MLELIIEAQPREGFARVVAIHLAVGMLGHVEPEALEFAFAAVTKGSLAEGARLALTLVPGEARCLDCGTVAAVESRLSLCPACGSARLRLTAGEELRLTELEVE